MFGERIAWVFAGLVLGAVTFLALDGEAWNRRRDNSRPVSDFFYAPTEDAGVGDGGDASIDSGLADSGVADVGASDGGVSNDAGYACYEVYNFLAWDTELQFVPACTEFSWLPGWIYVTNSGGDSEAIYCTGCTAQAGPSYYSLLTGCTRGATAIACGPGQYGCRMADPASSEGYLSVEALGFSPVGN